MTIAKQFANLLLVTYGHHELRAAGLDEFQGQVSDVVEASGTRLVAFRDESFMLDVLRADDARDLATFDSVEEVSLHLMESTDRAMRKLRDCLLLDPGSDEFDDDPTGPDEGEDDDSPELA